MIAYGPRVSVAVVGRTALDGGESAAKALALDVALHDQRGCLSPHAVFVEEVGAVTPREFAGRLAAALEKLVARLPPPIGTVEERAAVCVSRGGRMVGRLGSFGGPDGTVVYEKSSVFRASPG